MISKEPQDRDCPSIVSEDQSENREQPQLTVAPRKETTTCGANLGPHDVLLGRGLGTYDHIGNVNFRRLVTKNKPRYVESSKVDKPKVARELVQFWRKLGGRFLARIDPAKKGEAIRSHEGEWYEVGDKRAQQKTSQCLRERTPDSISLYKLTKVKKELLVQDAKSSMGGMRAVSPVNSSQGGQSILAQPSYPVQNQGGFHVIQPQQVWPMFVNVPLQPQQPWHQDRQKLTLAPLQSSQPWSPQAQPQPAMMIVTRTPQGVVTAQRVLPQTSMVSPGATTPQFVTQPPTYVKVVPYLPTIYG